MTQAHTIARDSAPTPAMSFGKRLHPKTVTVFLDAGPSGNKRAAHAVALARRWDAHLVGVHVVFTSEALHPPPGVGESSPLSNALWGFANLALGFILL
jgi:hypothetical protein